MKEKEKETKLRIFGGSCKARKIRSRDERDLREEREIKGVGLGLDVMNWDLGFY